MKRRALRETERKREGGGVDSIDRPAQLFMRLSPVSRQNTILKYTTLLALLSCAF